MKPIMWRPLPLKVPAVGLQCRTLGKREAFEAGSGDENKNEALQRGL